MPATAASDVTVGPVLSLINKRLRALRKKLNRIVQMEEYLSQGKLLNKEQEDVLDSKPYVTASIDELEKLRHPLAAAVTEEIRLAVKDRSDAVEDLLKLLYFGSMFNVRSQNDFASVMLTRTHERGCCLAYDYVTDDDAADLLGERDLDLISQLGGLLVSRPVDSRLSHKHALQRCVEHAKQWLANSDHPIDSDAHVPYAGLRAKLDKIMASDYFTITPEMRAPVQMAAAGGGNYGPFQVPVHDSVAPVTVSVKVEGSDKQYREDAATFLGDETYENQPSLAEEPQKGEFESENLSEVPPQKDHDEQQEEEQNIRDVETKEQHYEPRRSYQNKIGGLRGASGARRSYSNGGGGRGSGKVSGAYQNGGHNQYYDQPGNHYQRNYHYNNRERGGSSGNYYNNYIPKAQTGNAPHADS